MFVFVVFWVTLVMIRIFHFPLGDSPHVIVESKVQLRIPHGYESEGRCSKSLAFVPDGKPTSIIFPLVKNAAEISGSRTFQLMVSS